MISMYVVFQPEVLMYTFRIGVVGFYPEGADNETLDRMLNEAFDQLERGRSAAFEIAVHTSGKVARRARACATARHWDVVTAVTLPGTNPVLIYDGMVRIGGGNTEQDQIAQFRRRFSELPQGHPRPIVERD